MISIQQELKQVKFNKLEIDLSDLVQGYNMLFNSNYSDALEFFGQKKEVDIRFLIGYTQTLLARDQVQCLPPYDSISQAQQAVYQKISELAQAKLFNIEIDEDILDKIPFEENQILYWAMVQFINIQYFKYQKQAEEFNITSISKILKNAKIDPKEYDFTRFTYLFIGTNISNCSDLQELFLIQENNSNIEQELMPHNQENQLLPHNQENKSILHSQQEEQIAIEQQEEYVLNLLPNSSEVKNMIDRFIVLKLIYTKKSQENEQYFDQFLKMVPNFDLAWILKGDYFIFQLKYEKARPCYNRAILLNKQNSVAVNNMGYSYEYDNYFNDIEIDKYRKAIIFYQQAINICPHQWVFYNNVAVCSLAVHQYFEAIHFLLRSLEINPMYTNGLNRLLENFYLVEDDENFECLLKRSTVILQRNNKNFLKIFEICCLRKLLLFFNVLSESLMENFSKTATFILSNHLKLREKNSIFQLLEENLRFMLCNIAYQKNLKEYFTYQPSIFLWDLFIE